jgi:hypothetical protein
MQAEQTHSTQAGESLQVLIPIESEDAAGVATSKLSPDAVLPEQFYGSPRGTFIIQGQTALMRAVLDDAIGCYQKQFVSAGRRVQRLAKEAEEWFFSDEERWPFSFVNVCRALGIEPDYVRRGLKRRRQRPAAEPQRQYRRALPPRRPLRIAA